MSIYDKAIQDAAYYIWLKRGRPEGQDTEIWLEAKQTIGIIGEKTHTMKVNLSVHCCPENHKELQFQASW